MVELEAIQSLVMQAALQAAIAAVMVMREAAVSHTVITLTKLCYNNVNMLHNIIPLC